MSSTKPKLPIGTSTGSPQNVGEVVNCQLTSNSQGSRGRRGRRNRMNIIRLPVVKHRTGKSRSSIYDGIARGEFPQPISIGLRSVGWLESEIDGWIAARIEQSRVAKPMDVAASAIRGANTFAERVPRPRHTD